MSILAFDIEISNLFELHPGESLDRYAPFDISVAATYTPYGDWIIRFLKRSLRIG